MVVSNFILVLKKQHVSSGCKLEIFFLEPGEGPGKNGRKCSSRDVLGRFMRELARLTTGANYIKICPVVMNSF